MVGSSTRPRISRIGNKFYDLGTSNGSFLQVARDLKKLGIKNWYFLLEIRDPSVVSINPYLTDVNGNCILSSDQVSRVVNELTINPWYYLREVARIPDQGGTAVRYKANRGNIAQAYCTTKGYDSWLCLPRQKGKTQSALAIQSWAYNFGTTNSEFIFINKDLENAKTNLRRLVDQCELLPEYLHFDSLLDAETGKRIKAKKNATAIRHPVTHNSIIVKSQATSYEKALSLARGLTAPILHFDEPEFTNYIGTIVSNSASTFEQAAANARRNNAMAARIFTCTPGDLDTAFGKEAQEILDRTVQWTEKMYDWTDEEIQAYIDAKGRNCNKIFYIEYHYNQIGLNQKWLEDIAAKIGDNLVFRREILLQRLHGSSTSPFPQDIISYIVESEHKPIDELWLLEYFKFDIYAKLDKNIPYLVGVDCSTGTDGDNNAITIIDPRTIKPVAEFESSYIGETKYEKLLITLVQEYIPRAVLCIERNSVGDSIIDHLLESPIAGNLYYDRSRDLQDEKMRQNQTIESMLKMNAQRKTYYGVWTGTESRKQMMSILSRHVEEYKDNFITHNVIRDLSRLVRTNSGKVEAGPGFHDDSIMSYLIALYVYYFGNNLLAFGVLKGLQDEEIDNSGMKHADEINPALVSSELIAQVRQQEEFNSRKSYEDILKDALRKSQQESAMLAKKKLASNPIIENSTDDGTFDDTVGEIPLDFFSEINGF